MKDNKIKVFLDSGAFSVGSGKAKVTLDSYIDFIKKHEQYIEVYANLDVIGDAEKTLGNQKYMEDKGLRPLPTFHINEPFKYLEYYLENYDYIALGGVAKVRNRRKWLDYVFTNYLTDKGGRPLVKVHGFGVTEVSLIARYPWFSVDSISWRLIAAYGNVMVPRYDKNKESFIYNKASFVVPISEKSSQIHVEGNHYVNTNLITKKAVSDYFTIRGYREDELSKDSNSRSSLNALFFQNVVDSAPITNIKKQRGFFIKEKEGLVSKEKRDKIRLYFGIGGMREMEHLTRSIKNPSVLLSYASLPKKVKEDYFKYDK
jgi:hypothetical protein